ncbi:MAG: phosphoribosylformylglycinamidine synthase subunit PurS [Acidimicrobiia bacterium]
MKVTVEITRRPEIADPQGSTIQRALHDLGHNAVMSVRVDRVIHLELENDDPDAARAQVEEMCRQVLANPVLEDFTVKVDG